MEEIIMKFIQKQMLSFDCDSLKTNIDTNGYVTFVFSDKETAKFVAGKLNGYTNSKYSADSDGNTLTTNISYSEFTYDFYTKNLTFILDC